MPTMRAETKSDQENNRMLLLTGNMKLKKCTTFVSFVPSKNDLLVLGPGCSIYQMSPKASELCYFLPWNSRFFGTFSLLNQNSLCTCGGLAAAAAAVA